MNSSFASLVKAQHLITVSVLGDSLSYGYMVSAGYVHMLMDLLARHHPSHEFRSHNHGVCGDTARGGLSRLRRALLDPPADIALIQFGINDCFVGISASDFATAVSQIVKAYRAECPEGIVLLVPPPPVHPQREHLMLASFRQAMQQVAESLEVVCVPIDEHWPVDKSSPNHWLSDGVHPSEEGYRLMARAVHAALSPIPA